MQISVCLQKPHCLDLSFLIIIGKWNLSFVYCCEGYYLQYKVVKQILVGKNHAFDFLLSWQFYFRKIIYRANVRGRRWWEGVVWVRLSQDWVAQRHPRSHWELLSLDPKTTPATNGSFFSKQQEKKCINIPLSLWSTHTVVQTPKPLNEGFWGWDEGRFLLLSLSP